MAKTYDVGDMVRLGAAFTDPANGGAPIDPTAVTLVTRDPAGEETSTSYGAGAIIRDSVGTYHADVSADLAGTWQYRWYSTGAGQAAAQGYFVVRDKNVTA